MNPKLRDLQIQAFAECKKFEDGQFRTDEVFERFAELIVRECMMLVEGFESTQEVALDEYVDYEASAVLKEHFGVEE